MRATTRLPAYPIAEAKFADSDDEWEEEEEEEEEKEGSSGNRGSSGRVGSRVSCLTKQVDYVSLAALPTPVSPLTTSVKLSPTSNGSGSKLPNWQMPVTALLLPHDGDQSRANQKALHAAAPAATRSQAWTSSAVLSSSAPLYKKLKAKSTEHYVQYQCCACGARYSSKSSLNPWWCLVTRL